MIEPPVPAANAGSGAPAVPAVPAVPPINMASPKKDMLDAYHAMKAIIEAQQEAVLDAGREKERYRKAAAAAAAERATAEDPVQRVHQLRSSITRDLTDLAGRFEAEAEAYAKVREAVADKQAELARMFEVETAATDLAALIEAQRHSRSRFDADLADQRATLDAEMASQQAALDAEITSRRGALDAEIAGRQQQLADAATAEERRRERERDEYEYATKRERDQRRQALEDEIAALERDLAIRRTQAEQSQAAATAALDARAAVIEERERHVADLESQVQSLRTERDGAIERAVADATTRLHGAHEAQSTLQQRTFEGERNVLASRIEALTEVVERQNAQIERLTRQQEQAYEKVQEIASRAVDGARRVVTASGGAMGGGQREGGEG